MLLLCVYKSALHNYLSCSSSCEWFVYIIGAIHPTILYVYHTYMYIENTCTPTLNLCSEASLDSNTVGAILEEQNLDFDYEQFDGDVFHERSESHSDDSQKQG